MDDTKLQRCSQICFPIDAASCLISKPTVDDVELTYTQDLALIVLWESDGLSLNQVNETVLLNANPLSFLLNHIDKIALLQSNRSS